MNVNRLAADWLGYVMAWAERCERIHGDPVGLYANAAIDGLLAAIRTSNRHDSTLSIEHLNACLWRAGSSVMRTTWRRQGKLRQIRLIDHHPGRELTPIDAAIYREELSRHGCPDRRYV